jgi:hypothetical protein
MTWSIIARDAASGAFGVAIATRFFAVGALCPHAASGVGALSTQALMNPHYGKQALDLLRAGVPAPDVVKRLTAPDEGREHRQLHVIDSAGRIGQHTGAACVEWCGATAGEGYSVAGNMLAGKSVIDLTARVYEENPQLEFADRLILALHAGDARAGTSAASNRPRCSSIRPRNIRRFRSASTIIPSRSPSCAGSTRSRTSAFLPFMRCAPTKAQPSGTFDRQKIEQTITEYAKSRTRAP